MGAPNQNVYHVISPARMLARSSRFHGITLSNMLYKSRPLLFSAPGSTGPVPIMHESLELGPAGRSHHCAGAKINSIEPRIQAKYSINLKLNLLSLEAARKGCPSKKVVYRVIIHLYSSKGAHACIGDSLGLLMMQVATLLEASRAHSLV